jgi:ADP-heptose:LPS heptosyltransferase
MNDIVIAPFSNSDIRDWPLAHFSRLIGILLDRWDGPGPIRVIGTRNQVLRACEIVRPFGADSVANDCGRLTWPEVMRLLRSAACVVGNNSGVAHLAGFYGAPTVCVFGGSHQRVEWRPLGPNVTVVSRRISCSPCQRDHGQTSPFAKACLREIAPETVAEAVFATISRVATIDRQACAGGPAALRPPADVPAAWGAQP